MANSLVLEGFLVMIVKWKCLFDSMSRSFQEHVYDKFSKMSFYLHPSKYIMLCAFFSIVRFVAFNLVLNAFNSRFSSRSILVTQDDIYQHVRIMTQSHLSAYEIRKAIIRRLQNSFGFHSSF